MAAASELYRARVAVDMARSRLQQTAADAADAAGASEVELDADVVKHGGLAAALLVREATLATAWCRVHEGILQCAADATGSTPQEVLSRMRAAAATESAAHAADDAARSGVLFALAVAAAPVSQAAAAVAAVEAEDAADVAAMDAAAVPPAAPDAPPAAEPPPEEARLMETLAGVIAAAAQRHAAESPVARSAAAAAAAAAAARLQAALDDARAAAAQAAHAGVAAAAAPAAQARLAQASAEAAGVLALHARHVADMAAAASQRLAAAADAAAVVAGAEQAEADVASARHAAQAAAAEAVEAVFLADVMASERAVGEVAQRVAADAAAAAQRVAADAVVAAETRAEEAAAAVAALKLSGAPPLLIGGFGRASGAKTPGSDNYRRCYDRQNVGNGPEMVNTAMRDGDAAVVAALMAFLVANPNPTASELAAAFPVGNGGPLEFRWLWAKQQSANESWHDRVFDDMHTGVQVTGGVLLTQLTARHAAPGAPVSYIVHDAACRLCCSDLPEVLKTVGVRFMLRDLREAAHLAHPAGAAAIVGAVPAAVLLPLGLIPGFYLNTAAAVTRAHIVLLIVATCSTVRHVTELAVSIHLVVT
jgi:hypothetical protein